MKRWASVPVQDCTGKKRKVKSIRSLRALAAAEQSWSREVWLGVGSLGWVQSFAKPDGRRKTKRNEASD